MDIFLEAMVDGLKKIVDYALVGCAGVVGVGLTIFGLKYSVSTIKSFFMAITERGEYGGEYEDSWEYYNSGQYDSDYDYDINS